jgi:hypothetical protein
MAIDVLLCFKFAIVKTGNDVHLNDVRNANDFILNISGAFSTKSLILLRQPIGGQDSMQTVIRTSRRLDSILREAAQNLE